MTLLLGQRTAPTTIHARRQTSLQPTKFELVINLETAKDLDISFHSTLPARAEVTYRRNFRWSPYPA